VIGGTSISISQPTSTRSSNVVIGLTFRRLPAGSPRGGRCGSSAQDGPCSPGHRPGSRSAFASLQPRFASADQGLTEQLVPFPGASNLISAAPGGEQSSHSRRLHSQSPEETTCAACLMVQSTYESTSQVTVSTCRILHLKTRDRSISEPDHFSTGIVCHGLHEEVGTSPPYM
jgi:hypothetical protein